MEIEQLKEFYIKAKEYEKIGTVSQIIDNYYGLEELVITKDKQIDLGLEIGRSAKEYLLRQLDDRGYTFASAEEYVQSHKTSDGFIDAYYDFLRLEAPFWLDSFKLYIEKNRPRRERFYEPRRNTLIKITNAIQRLENDKLDVLFLHQAPRTGKSGDLTMDMVWHCSRDTESSNLYVTYKEGLGGAFLTGFCEIMIDPTYCYKDVFPDVKIIDTDAKNNKIDLGTDRRRKKKYKSLSGKGLESGLNGEYDASGWLTVDDPLEGVQDVLSEDVLKRKQTIFDNNVLSRRKEKCKLILMGTLWSTKDLFSNYLEFIESSPDMKDTRYEVIKIPALDPETDESNFDYDYGVGFSTAYYRGVRSKFENNDDMVGWSCQYQQMPIEREGAVFNPEHMNYYKDLPGGEPIKIIAHCDVALGGGDYLSFPIVYYYETPNGSLVGYVEDVVFDNSEKSVTQPQVLAAIKRNHVKWAHFEANAGGEGYMSDIERMLKDDKEYKEVCNFRSDYAPTTMRKDQRIWDNAQDIRELYFKEPTHRHLQYRKFMQNLFSFTMGKNKHKHEDAADGLAGLVAFEREGSGVTKAVIMKSPI